MWGGLRTICPGRRPGPGGCLQAFALACLGGCCCQVGLLQDPLVVQLVLGGGLVARVGLWLDGEARELTAGQVGLHGKYGGVSHLGLLQGMALLPVQDTIDATHYSFWTLHLHQVGGLQEAELVVST